MSLDGFSMRPLTQELDTALAGGRIDKITQPNKQTIVIAVRQPGKNHLLHITANPANPAAHLLSKPLENPPEPPTFCMVLRKQLEAGRIASIHQHGLDRLLLIDIDTLAKGGLIVTKTLVLELMGKYSNFILVENGRIIDALRRIGEANSRVRTVLPGDEYVLPPEQDKLDLFTSPMEEIIRHLKALPELKLQKALLSVCEGFGPISAREAAFAAGLDKNILISSLDDADFASLAQALTELKQTASQPDRLKPTIVTDQNHKILAMAAFPLHYLSEGTAKAYPSMSAMLDDADRLTGSYVLPDKDRFARLIKNELNRARNKIVKLDAESEAAENAEEWKIKGDNLQTYQFQFHDHADASITVPDIYSTEGEEITIDLDQRFSLMQNMQNFYKKYDKLKRAQALLVEQKEECRENIRYLESIETSLSSSRSLAEIDEIHRELIAGGYLREKPKKKNKDKPAAPFRFISPDGLIILVGKNNYQNDRLTFKTASYNDTWLHAKDIPGSHVILRNEGQSPSSADLLLAAKLAAHFSKARGGSNIPVDYTQVRYVKKPSGAKPGFVIFTHQQTLYVTPDDELTPILAQATEA